MKRLNILKRIQIYSNRKQHDHTVTNSWKQNGL